MQCKSCQTNIDPKWKHAIAQNVCPFCGQEVMEELLKTLLSTLQETMDKLQNYPEQLNDWMLSNHNYIKTDSPNLINFVPKELLTPAPTRTPEKEKIDQPKEELTKKIIKIKHKDGTEEEVVSEVKKTQSETNAFFDRAQGKLNKKSSTPAKSSPEKQEFTSIAEKTAYLGQLAKKIKEKAESPIANQESLADLIENENNDDIDPDENDIGDEVEIEERPSFKRANASPPPRRELDDEAEMADQILSMNMAAKGMGENRDGSYNPKDAALLQRMQMKKEQSLNNFESGANRGKGGFSRSS